MHTAAIGRGRISGKFYGLHAGNCGRVDLRDVWNALQGVDPRGSVVGIVGVLRRKRQARAIGSDAASEVTADQGKLCDIVCRDSTATRSSGVGVEYGGGD